MAVAAMLQQMPFARIWPLGCVPNPYPLVFFVGTWHFVCDFSFIDEHWGSL